MNRAPTFSAVKTVLSGVLLAFLLSACTQKAETPAPVVTPQIKNVLIITIDTLRADALSIYGNPERSPFFERMARDSIVFDRAFTVAPLTLPAHASLFTGLYPPAHGVRNNGTFRASPALKLLPEIAREHGYNTAAIIGGFPLAARFGLNQGFELYDDSFSSLPLPGTFHYAEKNAESVRLSAQSWLEKQQSKSFFLWMHFFDPHHPYVAHDQSALQPYLQEVHYVDHQLELFFDFLRTKNSFYNTLVVIAGDHGEAFGEHGETSHSIFVYNTTLRIPFVVYAPGYAGQRRSEVVRIIDILPTVLELMNWKSTESMEGISLVPLLKGNTIPALDAYSETLAPALDFGWSPLYAIQNTESKYIQAPRAEFYDLKSDAGETKNLAASVSVESYKKKIQAIQSRKPPDSKAAALSAEEKEKLESLGYFSSPVHLKNVSTVDPKDRIDVARKIGELATSQQKLEDKAVAYKELIRLDPSNPILLLRYAEILLKMKRLSEASEIFKKVISQEYESAAPYNGLASVYFQQNKVALAENTLELAEQRNVADGETFYNHAEILLNRGEFQKAMLDYGFSMNFGFPATFHRVYKLAFEFHNAGNLEKSQQFARLFLEHAPPEMSEQRALVEKLQ